VWGVLHSHFTLSFGQSLDLDLMIGEEAPPATGALVVPQDVYLILGEVTAIAEQAPVRTPTQALSEAARQRPCRRGTVLAGPQQPGRPLLLQAIVYDFEDSPPTREAYVFEALMSAFEEASGRRVTSLALQPLGTAHAGIEPLRFVTLLMQVCYSAVELGTRLRHVHLMLSSPAELEMYERLLRELAGDGAAF
jgi:hypothetical protein